MLREIDLNEISDGKLYGINDLVKAGCNDCKGCADCCRGMGESVILDPFDIYNLSKGTGKNFDGLLKENVALRVVDGLILPYLMMTGDNEQCTFLNDEGRCNIHAYRPGFCRLFPLGRVYDDAGFKYFLQVNECTYANRTKVKVKKWIDVTEPGRYEQFIKNWHFFQKNIQHRLNVVDDMSLRKKITMLIIQIFYQTAYETDDFYNEFGERLKKFPSF